MSTPRGFIFYQGPSLLDGQPIVAIATLKTSNAKTGDMIQTWILRSDLSPLDASKAMLDGSICGACPHRRSLGGACYVNIGQAPQGVYKAFTRGAYPVINERLLGMVEGRGLRMGAYGDPAAVPMSAWRPLLDVSAMHTGYTHQISHAGLEPELLDYVMVSADTVKSAMKQQSKGLRTFRVKTPDADLLPGEIECLADSKGLSCAECGLCDGAKGRPNVAITVHGSLSSRYQSKYAKANLIPAVSV